MVGGILASETSSDIESEDGDAHGGTDGGSGDTHGGDDGGYGEDDGGCGEVGGGVGGELMVGV